MSDVRTRVTIGLVDQITAGLKTINGGLKDLSSQIAKNAEGFKEIGLASGAIGAGITAGLTLAVNSARDAKRVMDGLEQVVRSTGGAAGITAKEADALSQSLQKVTNFSDEQVKSAETMLLTFTKIGKDVFPQATETVLNLATAMGGDAQGAAIQLGKAMNNPVEGITALTRVGVQFSDAQKKQIEGFMKVNDIASAQKIILNELATEFGGQARAAVDPIKQLTNSIDDIGETIGNALLPAVNQIASQVRDAANRFNEWAQKNPALVKSIVEITAAVGLLLSALGGLTVAAIGISKIWQGLVLIQAALVGAFNAIAGEVTTLRIAFMYLAEGEAVALPPLFAFIAVVGAAVAAGALIIGTLKKIEAAWQQTAQASQESVEAMGKDWDGWNAASAQLTGNEQEYAKLRAKAQYYILQATLLTEKQISLIRQHASQEQLDAVQHDIDVNNQWAKEAADAAIDYGKAHEGAASKAIGAFQNIKKGFSGLSQASGASSDSQKDDMKEVQKALEDLGTQYRETQVDINRKLLQLDSDHKTTMESIRKEIQSTADAISKLQIDYAKSTAKMTEDHNKMMNSLTEDRSDEVVKQFQKIKDLQEEMNKFREGGNEGFLNDKLTTVIANRQDKEGTSLSSRDARAFNLTDDQVQMVNTTLELQKQQEALKKYLETNLKLSDDVKNQLTVGSQGFVDAAKKALASSPDLTKATNKADLTDFERSIAENDKRKAEEAKTFNERSDQERLDMRDKLLNLTAEKDALEKKGQAAEKAYQSERAELVATKIEIQVFETAWNAAMQSVDKQTKLTADNLKAQLESIRSSLSQISSLTAGGTRTAKGTPGVTNPPLTKFADGGIVDRPTRALIGEGKYKEAVIPMPDGRHVPVEINTPPQKPNITVSFGEVHIHNDMDERGLMQKIVDAITNQSLKAA